MSSSFVTIAFLGLTSALALPNHALTPGAVVTRDRNLVCSDGYAERTRHAYDREWIHFRTAMFRGYGMDHSQWRSYTVDHLVPIELGGLAFGYLAGSYDLRNVWPQPHAEAIRKDAVENALHAAICYRDGYRGVHLGLVDAQRAIARDWTRTPVGLPPVEARRYDTTR